MVLITGHKVSRADVFGADPEPESAPAALQHIDLAFVDAEPVPEPLQNDLDGFQLFGGVTVSADALEPPPPSPPPTQRPVEFYLYKSTPALAARCRSVAVNGGDFVFATTKSTLDDVNAHYKSPKRRCRLGSKARKRRVERRQLKARQDAAAAAAARFSRRRFW